MCCSLSYDKLSVCWKCVLDAGFCMYLTCVHDSIIFTVQLQDWEVWWQPRKPETRHWAVWWWKPSLSRWLQFNVCCLIWELDIQLLCSLCNCHVGVLFTLFWCISKVLFCSWTTVLAKKNCVHHTVLCGGYDVYDGPLMCIPTVCVVWSCMYFFLLLSTLAY